MFPNLSMWVIAPSLVGLLMTWFALELAVHVTRRPTPPSNDGTPDV